MINYDRQAFGKAVRTKRGPLPPRDFAHKLHVSTAVLSRVERGKIVDEDVIIRVCRELELDITEFPAGKAGEQRGTSQ